MHTSTDTQRELLTVSELAKRYRSPKSSIYQLLRENPQAGVIRLGRRVLIDAAVFDRFVTVGASVDSG